MIRFTALHLENFHLARDLVIPLARDPDRNLAVIRAEPGTGKTTVFRAFRWALYGDDGLPNDGRGYPLSSMNLLAEREETSIRVAVTVDFEVHTPSSLSRYKLTRSVREAIGENGNRRRPAADLVLMKENSAGWLSVENAPSHVARLFPSELKDVFFTDGDEAMRFIARDVSTDTKRSQVRMAIRNLLGIGLLEESEKHLSAVAAAFNAEIRTRGGNTSLTEASTALEQSQQSLEEAEGALDGLRKKHAQVDAQRSSWREKLDAALKRGNKPELERQLHDAEDRYKRADEEIKQVNREKSDLLRTQAASALFTTALVSRAVERLTALKDEGAIPSDYLPLLRERIDGGRCICGAELSPGSDARAAVEKLIESQQATSEVKDRLTSLYFTAAASPDHSALSARLSGLESRYARAIEGRQTDGGQVRALELQIKQLGSEDIDQIQATYKDFDDQLRKLTAALGVAEAEVRSRDRVLKEAKTLRDKLLEAEKDAGLLQAKLLVASDLRGVIAGSKKLLEEVKVQEVSAEMDRLFRRMIGADSEGAVIKRAEITPTFDVVVYSKADVPMDPDLQLNGAARRAITLAFILALASVSGAKAPNVIDTPLGMMGIQVKQAALSTLVEESAQPILFLTYAEIRDIEGALDRAVGSIVTLTMTGHFPTYLKNQPPVDEPEILVCSCDHRSSCELCERVFTTADVEVTA